MSGLLASIILTSLLLPLIWLLYLSYKKYYRTPYFRIVSFGWFLFFIVYLVFQTAIYMYSMDYAEIKFVWIFASPFVVSGALLFFVIHKKLTLRTSTHDINSKILTLTLAIYFAGLFVSSFAVDRMESYCVGENRVSARKIIDAVNEYKIAEDNIPENLDTLIPKYVDEIPSPKCFSLYRPLVPVLTDADFLRSMEYSVMMRLIQLKEIDYHLKKCEWDEDDMHYVELYLLVPTVDLNERDRYDFSSGLWQSISNYGSGCSGFTQS